MAFKLNTLSVEPATQMVVDLDWDSALKKSEEQPWETGHDVLAQSWCSYHKLDQLNSGPTYTPLDDLIPSDHDRDMADRTRRYYSDRIMLRMLKGHKISKFQSDLYHVLTTGQWLRSHRGMAHKLPFFYVEDHSRAELMAENQVEITREHMANGGDLVQRQLSPLRKILSLRRGQDTMQYWWRDQNDHLVLWPVLRENPLGGIVAAWHQSGQVLRIQARYRATTCHRSEQMYWVVYGAGAVDA